MGNEHLVLVNYWMKHKILPVFRELPTVDSLSSFLPPLSFRGFLSVWLVFLSLSFILLSKNFQFPFPFLLKKCPGSTDSALGGVQVTCCDNRTVMHPSFLLWHSIASWIRERLLICWVSIVFPLKKKMICPLSLESSLREMNYIIPLYYCEMLFMYYINMSFYIKAIAFFLWFCKWAHSFQPESAVSSPHLENCDCKDAFLV